MSATVNTGAASAVPFDPTLWLGAFSEIGGAYALTADRRLCLIVADCPADALAPFIRQIVGRPERQEGIKRAIEARQLGEAAI